MGSICGIFNFNNKPADPGLLYRINNIYPNRGPDRHFEWVDGNVGLGSRILFTTIESTKEQQPASSCDGNYLIVFDGILYNRTELISELINNQIHTDAYTDSEIIVNLYSLYGLKCLNKLNGDYSFVILDTRAKKMICVRDCLGNRPLYYYFSKNNYFLFASQINQLLADNNISKIPNENFIGEAILNICTNDEETLYQNIFRLPPASCLIIKENSTEKFKYWDFDPENQLIYKDDYEYVENFKHLLSKSVRNCLRSNGRVGTTLSGGLDSSAVTSLAHEINKNDYDNQIDLSVYSLVFPGLDCDESKYIKDLSDHISKPVITFCPVFDDYDWYPDDIDKHMNFPFFPNVNMCKPIYRELNSDGVRIMLTGLGGDEWLRGDYFYLSDLLLSKNLDLLTREIIKIYHSYGVLQTLTYLYAYLLKPSLPKKVKNKLRDIIKLLTLKNIKTVLPNWYSCEFAEKIDLIDKLDEINNRDQFKLHSQNFNHNTLHNFIRILNQEDSERFSSYYSVEDRHPFNNIELVEFCFSIPEYKKINSIETKLILRKAMNSYLPRSISNRRTKANFSRLIMNTIINKKFYDIISDLKISEIGWIDKNQLLCEYSKMLPYLKSNHQSAYKFMWQISLIYSVEMCYRKIFSS